MNLKYRHIYHCPEQHIVEMNSYEFSKLNRYVCGEILTNEIIICPFCKNIMEYVGIVDDSTEKHTSNFYKIMIESSNPLKYKIQYNLDYKVNYETGEIID